MMFFDPGDVLEGGEVEYDPVVAGLDITDTGEGNIDDDGASKPSNKDDDDVVSKDLTNNIFCKT